MKKTWTIMGDWRSALNSATENIPKHENIGITNILNWVYALAGLVAVGFIVFGAINYALSQGDPGKAKQAGQTILYAIIGLAVVLLAAAITNFAVGAV